MGLQPELHFPDIGAYVGTLSALARNKGAFEGHIVAAVEQLDSSFVRVSILPSFISNMVSARNAITSGEGNIISAASDYHTSVLAPELASAGTTVAAVIGDLFASMAAHEPPQTFLEDGHFHAFYRDRFGRQDVPTAPAGTNTVDDALGD